MIDAVAKAIMLWAVPYNDWDAISDEQRERWRNAARAAIGAMRKPSPAMSEACYENDLIVPTHQAWPRMIDAALDPANV